MGNLILNKHEITNRKMIQILGDECLKEQPSGVRFATLNYFRS